MVNFKTINYKDKLDRDAFDDLLSVEAKRVLTPNQKNKYDESMDQNTYKHFNNMINNYLQNNQNSVLIIYESDLHTNYIVEYESVNNQETLLTLNKEIEKDKGKVVKIIELENGIIKINGVKTKEIKKYGNSFRFKNLN